MKPEDQLTNPTDLFSSENFVTASEPEEQKMSEADAKLLSQIKKTGVTGFQDIEDMAIPDLHKEEQLVSAQDKASINEKFDRQILAHEKAEMAAQSLRNKNEPIKTPQDIFKSLIAFGDHKEKIKLYQHVWELRCLDQSDILAASDEVNDYSEGRVGYLTSYTFSKLVYAIESIDGISIYELFSDINYQDYSSKVTYITAVKRALRSWLLALPDVIIMDLIDAYLEMENKRAEEIRKLKNS